MNFLPFRQAATAVVPEPVNGSRDRKSTRLNSSHQAISYAVFCLKKKTRHAGPSAVIELFVPCLQTLPYCIRAAALDILAAAKRLLAVTLEPVFFLNDAGPTEISPLTLHFSLPI